MESDNKCTLFVAGLTLAMFLLLAASPGWGEPNDRVDQTIQHLISHVSGSGLTFIRNAREYTPAEAAEHMNKKYRHFRDDIETPEDFIELCASKSLLSGKPYLVVAGKGEQLRTSDWMRTELAAYQERVQ